MGGMLLWEWQRKTVIVSAVVLIPIRTVVIDMVRLHASVVMLVGNVGILATLDCFVNIAVKLNVMVYLIWDGVFSLLVNQENKINIEHVIR